MSFTGNDYFNVIFENVIFETEKRRKNEKTGSKIQRS